MPYPETIAWPDVHYIPHTICSQHAICDCIWPDLFTLLAAAHGTFLWTSCMTAMDSQYICNDCLQFCKCCLGALVYTCCALAQSQATSQAWWPFLKGRSLWSRILSTSNSCSPSMGRQVYLRTAWSAHVPDVGAIKTHQTCHESFMHLARPAGMTLDWLN